MKVTASDKFWVIIKMLKNLKLSAIVIISFICLFFMIGLTSALLISSVQMDPEKIAPGEKSTVTLSLKNNGDNDLSDVSISLDLTNLPLAPSGSGSEVTINELNSDKTKDAVFQIVALNDAKSGIYKIPVNIAYTENDNPKTQKSLISIMVYSQPIIEVTYDDGLLLKGQNNKVTIKIINKGLADVKFLETRVDPSTSYSITSQNNVYIGDIDSNDFQTADFNVFLNQNEPRNVNFPVSIKYKDITSKEYTKNYNIQLKTFTNTEAQDLGLVPKNNTIYIFIAVIVLIVVFFIYRAIRKRRKRQAESL